MTADMVMVPPRYFSIIKLSDLNFITIFKPYFQHMKKLFLSVLLFVSALMISNQALATHAAGGELIYTVVDPTTNTYKFIFKFYRDCSGSTEPATFQLCGSPFNAACAAPFTATLTKVVGNLPNGQPNGSPVTTGCPGFPTTCNGGSIPGYREWWYEGTVTLPAACNYWRFFVQLCCRNNGINNLITSGSQNIFIEAHYDNTITPNNNSPYFSNPPIAYFCINQPANVNYAAIDPDGDSVVYESIEPRTNASCTYAPNQIFAAGFSIIEPFPTGNTFTLNTATGAISFTPTVAGKWVFTIKVKEYRNGQYIGFIMRDIQIVVDNCNTPSPTLNIDTLTITAGQLVNGVIQGCAEDTLNFCFDLESTYPLAVLVPSDNSTISLPGATVTYQNTLTDSIRACVTWPTTILDTGLHVLTITVKDSSCQPPGFLITNTFSIPININPITKAFGDTSICTGDSAPLSVYGGSSFTWTALPGGSGIGSLSCTNCNNPVASPTVTTSYVVTSNLSSICNQSTDTVTVQVATGPVLTVTPDTTTCVNAQLQLNVSPIPSNQAYNYTWAPAANLNNANIANPIVSGLTNNTTFTVTVVPQGILACQSVATVDVEVLLGFDIGNSDTSICLGESVQINPIGGNPKYTYTWTPPTNVSNPTIIDPVITPNTFGVFPYTITASFPGCPDSSQSLTITVDPNPLVTMDSLSYTICRGDTLHLNATVTPPGVNYAYQWAPGADLVNANTLNPIFDGLTTTALTLTATSPIGCVGTGVTTINVIPADFLNIVKGDEEICPNEIATLEVSGSIKHVWAPSYLVSDSTANVVTTQPVTTTTYYVYGIDDKGCKDTVKTTVVVNPGAVLDAGDRHVIYPGESAQLYANGNCSFFTWTPPNGLTATDIKNPIATPSVSTRYFVTASTESGCSATDSVDVIVSPESVLELPNAFSPGAGTSVNDELKIIIRGVATLNSFRIFNRWGQEVFYTTDISKGWNGQLNGKPQPMGAYVYVIDAVSSTGKRFYKQGNVTLIR
jgi:gliding motility-associated-like protein